MENGIPSHDTFGRVFAGLDTGEFLSAMHGWADEFAGNLRNKGVAIDGKTLRGSFDKASGKSAVHTITAFAVGTRTQRKGTQLISESMSCVPFLPPNGMTLATHNVAAVGRVSGLLVEDWERGV